MHRAAPPRHRRWRPAHVGRGDRGSVSLEVAVLGPALLLLVVAVVQAGLWFHARTLALAAAQQGVAAGRGYGATPTDGTDRAHAFLARAGRDSLLAARVSSAGSSPSRVRIEVSGRALSLLPGVAGPTVRAHAEGPVERFTTAGTP